MTCPGPSINLILQLQLQLQLQLHFSLNSIHITQYANANG